MPIHLVTRVGPEMTPEERFGVAEYFADETQRILKHAVQQNPELLNPTLTKSPVNFLRETAGVDGLPEGPMDAYTVSVFAERKNGDEISPRTEIARVICSYCRFSLMTNPHWRHYFDDTQFHARLVLLANYLAGRPVSPVAQFFYL